MCGGFERLWTAEWLYDLFTFYVYLYQRRCVGAYQQKQRIITVSHKIAFNRALINRRSYRRAGSSIFLKLKKIQKKQHGLGIYTDTSASAR